MALVPECVVCLQPYDDFRHVPRVLACGHSFCELCLMQLQSAWRPSLTDKKDGPGAGAVIRCPECNHRTRLPVGGQQSLPKNVELLRLLPSLIREADCPEYTETDTGQKSAGLMGVDGIANSRVALDAAGSRRSGGKRSKGKGKERIDSDCLPGNVSGIADSWLVPCDLYSENFNGDLRTWILPEKSIKLREDSPRFRPVNNSQRELLRGEIVLEQGRMSSCIPVTLRQLEVSCPQDEKLSYELTVLKAWEGCPLTVKTELLILFRISLISSRVSNVFGVWMDTRNKLFLVSRIPAHETVSAWGIIKRSFQTELSPDIEYKVVDERNESNEITSVRDDVSLSSSELVQVELSKMPIRKVFSGVAEQTLSRVGLGLCELLWEVHSQGLIFGLLSPNCFVLDHFGTLLIDVNAALNDRSTLHNATARASSTKFQRGGSGSTEVQENLDPQNSRNCWQYMSPEALLINNLSYGKDPKETAGIASSTSEKVQGLLTCKADIWSLGCLLLELMSGKPPYDGLTFPEVVQKILVEREKPGDFLSLDFFLEHSRDGRLDVKKSSFSSEGLKNLLSKCFEYDPDERPELDVLYRDLMGLELFNLIPTRSIPENLLSGVAGSADQKYWIFCLPGFAIDGYLDSWQGREADLEASQRHLERLRLDNRAADDGRELQPCGLEQKGSLEGHQDYVTALVVCGDHLLSASFDKTIRVWSLEDHVLQQTLEGHSHVVAALAVDHNTFRCFSGDTGGKICAWKLGEDTTEPLIETWQVHDDWRYTGVASLAVSADGILYSGSGDRTIKAWSLQDFGLLGSMEGHNALVSALLVDGELLYSGSWDGTIRVWWRNDHSLVAVLGGGASAVPSLGSVRAMCMSDSFLFAGRDSGAIQVWRDEECLTTEKAHDMVVSTLYVEGDFLYTGSWDQQIKAWKIDQFLSDPYPTLVKKCGSALSSIVSDGDRLYAGLAEREIKVYSLLGETWASLVQMLNPSGPHL